MEPHKMPAPPSSAAHAAVLRMWRNTVRNMQETESDLLRAKQMVDDHTAHLEKLHTDRTELENHAAQNDWELS